jgi:hypothetical protein
VYAEDQKVSGSDFQPRRFGKAFSFLRDCLPATAAAFRDQKAERAWVIKRVGKRFVGQKEFNKLEEEKSRALIVAGSHSHFF